MPTMSIVVNGREIDIEGGSGAEGDADICITSNGITVGLSFDDEDVRLIVGDENGKRAFAHRQSWTEADGSYWGIIASLKAFAERNGSAEDWPRPEDRPL